MKYGYIRVSTNTQDETRQKEAMYKASVLEENIFLDKASGKHFIARTEWQKLLAKVIIGDVIVIKELDRLARNNEEIKENYELIQNKGVFLEFTDDTILNTFGKTPIERELIQPLVLHLLGYMAEKEREKLLARQKEAYKSLERDEKGRMISRKKKKIVGRPSKLENLSLEQKRYIEAWINGSLKTSDCVKSTGIGRASLFKLKKESRKDKDD